MLREKKEKIRRSLSRIPAWLFTILTVAAILWLTLVPHPLGDEEIPLFPGADKIVHAIMFGGLTLMILLDYQRRTPAHSGASGKSEDSGEWHPLKGRIIWSAAIISSIFGITIEYLQWAMQLGRGFEIADMIADTVGAFIASTIWLLLQPRWSTTSSSNH